MRLRSGKAVQSIFSFGDYSEFVELPDVSNNNRASDVTNIKEFDYQTQFALHSNTTAAFRAVPDTQVPSKLWIKLFERIFSPIFLMLSMLQLNTHRSQHRSKSSQKPKRSFLTWFVHIFNTTIILLMLYRYFILVNVDEFQELGKHGLDNGMKVTFESNVPNWYVAPEKLKGLPSHLVLNSGAPIVMYVRGDSGADSDTFHRINMLKNLALNGFNVVAPLSTSETDLVKVWTRLQMRSEPTKIYLWFDHTSIEQAQELAKVLSETVSPPVAAIVERKVRYDIPDLEVWSTRFTSLKTDNVGKINYLKCPVTTTFPGTSNHQEIQTCFGTVNGNKYFH